MLLLRRSPVSSFGFCIGIFSTLPDIAASKTNLNSETTHHVEMYQGSFASKTQTDG